MRRRDAATEIPPVVSMMVGLAQALRCRTGAAVDNPRFSGVIFFVCREGIYMKLTGSMSTLMRTEEGG